MLIEINNVTGLGLAVIVLILGDWLTKRVTFLRQYDIPTPVTGGIIASILIGVLYLWDIRLQFAEELRDILLLAFFSTIGLSARIKLLLDGGRLLLILMGLTAVFLIAQNAVGLFGAVLLNVDPLIGLLSGSITLSGGHGTGAAYAKTFYTQFGLENAMEIAMACATFGLVAAGVLGGPLATFIIKRFKIHAEDEFQHSFAQHKPFHKRLHVDDRIDYRGILESILMITVCIVVGRWLTWEIIVMARPYFPNFVLPQFVPCLFVGIVIINALELWRPYQIKTKSLAICSSLSLDIFLALSLMNLKLWTLVELAVPLLSILLTQVLLAFLFVYFIVFRASGYNYTASVISSGYIGFGLGATPTAIANMSAVTKHHGPSPKAFLVIPLIGAFFIDIANATIIQIFLSLPFFR
ncbi:MAG: sodium/glutamate symporter [Legionellales bacterium]|nr:sodium/glutamate symporter [Legionellales bacterium]